jgi:putative NADPH-quinone reductase
MRVLIVFCHPAPDSLLGAMRARTDARLAAEGHEVETIDLYAEGFDPVMPEADWRAHRRFERPGDKLDRHVEALLRTEALVLIYPTWWFGMPAMLKGWFERIWQPKIALDFEDGEFQIHKLKNITRFAAISSHGSPRFFIDWLMGNPGLKTLRGLKLQLAPGAKLLWRAFYNVDAASREKNTALMARFESDLARFLSQKP